MLPSRASVGLLVLLLSCLALGGPARADDVEQARAYVNKATGAYALSHYAVAAENFEKAFELKPDPALLYNAAQAYRLAGNKERALELYESYVRVYTGKKDMRPDIEGHIRQLKEAIERDRAAATSPPITTMPMGGTPGEGREPPPTSPPPVTPIAPAASASTSTPAPAAIAPPPASAAPASSPVVLTQSAGPPETSDSVTKKTWFWVAVGGGVAAAVIVGLLIGLSGTDPASASIGKVNGN